MSGGDRSGADDVLIAALLAGLTIARAAEQAGVSEATAHRRLRDEAFTRRLNAERREVVAAVTARLAGIATAALDRLHGLLAGEETPPPQLLGAIRESLRHLAVLSEVADSQEVAGRLAAVERRLGLAAVDGEAAA